MRRNPFPAIAIGVAVLTGACGHSTDATSGGDAVVTGPPQLAATAARVADESGVIPNPVGVPAVWPLDFETTLNDITPYTYFGTSRIRPGTAPYFAWCQQQGIYVDIEFDRMTGSDIAGEECLRPYLESRGVSGSALELFLAEHITVWDVQTLGAVSVAHAFDWDSYWSNAWHDRWVFVPSGILDLSFTFGVAYQPAFDSTVYAQPDYEKISEYLAGLGETDPPDTMVWSDIEVGVPSSVGGPIEVPVTWMMHTFCHGCQTPFAIEATLVFDPAGTPSEVRFEGFCFLSDYADLRRSDDPTVTYDTLGLPDCTLDPFADLAVAST